jgi:hypothetical protein
MGLIIVDSVTPSQQMGVDATPRAGRVILYGPNGQPLAPSNRAAVDPTGQAGIIGGGADYKIARIIRASPDGTLRASQDSLYFFDAIEGAAVDTNKWIQTTTTMTITQAVATGMLFNAGSSIATTVGAMQASHRRFPFIGRTGLAFRCRARPTAHQAGNIIELGLTNPPATATTAIVPDGFFWRKDSTGQWLPVMSVNGAEVLGTTISNATFIAAIPTTDYAYFEVFVEEGRATFSIITNAGIIVSTQIIDFSAASGLGTFQVTHLGAFLRCWNVSATTSAVQLFVAQAEVFATDSLVQRPWQDALAAMGHGSLTSPTAFTQLANYANSAAPGSATLSNTAAGYTNLGGQWQFAAVAGAETDYALFAFQNPLQYTFICKRVRISAYNMGAAVATTATMLQWGLGFNSSAVSLATGAPYPYMRKAIGSQSIAVGGTIGQNFTPEGIEWLGAEPVLPNRFFAIILKIPVGTATASQVIRGTADVEGYFDG